jgi:ketosteroid isomerase-like protein
MYRLSLRFIKLSLFALTLGMISSPLLAVDVSGGSEQDREELMRMTKAWGEDYISGNIDGLMAIMHEDAMIMAQKQAGVSGKEAIEAYFTARAGKPGVTFTDDLQEVNINGNWAYIRGNFLLEVAPWEEGKPGFKRNGRYFVLYEKNDAGEWKMLRDIDNDLPAE